MMLLYILYLHLWDNCCKQGEILHCQESNSDLPSRGWSLYRPSYRNSKFVEYKARTTFSFMTPSMRSLHQKGRDNLRGTGIGMRELLKYPLKQKNIMWSGFKWLKTELSSGIFWKRFSIWRKSICSLFLKIFCYRSALFVQFVFVFLVVVKLWVSACSGLKILFLDNPQPGLYSVLRQMLWYFGLFLWL
jgi:hypothetical protein